MKTLTPIPVLPGNINGWTTQLVDARVLHAFLQSRQDYSTWIKSRIVKYGFEVNIDYLLHKFVEQVPHQGGLRTTKRFDYFLTLDMAKELAMIERTARGRQARRYFIECERQLQQLRQSTSLPAAVAVQLTRAERQAINRQAWADVASHLQASFHARREALVRQYCKAKEDGPAITYRDCRPSWAK